MFAPKIIDDEPSFIKDIIDNIIDRALSKLK